jgi:hypothetical protein
MSAQSDQGLYDDKPRHDAFLSSGFYDLGDLKPLREETRRCFASHDLDLWTWEHWRNSAEGHALKNGRDWEQVAAFEQIAAFRRALLNSGIVILFLANRRGSQIRPWSDDLSTYGTFLELEVYFAAAVKKPIILFRESGGYLEPPIAHLLTLARRAGTIRHEETIARGELPKRALDAFHRTRNRLDSSLGRLTTLLAIRRDPRLDFRTATPFLFNLSLPSIIDQRPHPDLDVIDRLLAEEQGGILPMSERLSRLWLAIQEILPARPLLDRNRDLRDRWLQVLERWSAAASWFGLHAHLAVSPFTAQAERARLVEASRAGQPLPFGALASARYSIARRESYGWRRYREFVRVADDAGSALEAGAGDRAGFYSIMGHAYMQNGRLFAAVHAFEDSLRIRSSADNDARIGEGMADLGFVLFLTLKRERGIRIMEEGIARLEASGAVEFLLKSMKKLELAYRLAGRKELALRLRQRRLRLAVEREAFDQA